MRRRAFLGAAAGVAGATLAAACDAVSTRGPAHARPGQAWYPPGAWPAGQFRGTWIASYRNIDWPSRPGLPASEQQRELAALLDTAQRLRLNAVLLQVRPSADALYPSRYEPWSAWLSGAQGRPPGYDPLAFAISAAHARGLQLHAWFNPFRVGDAAARSGVAASHPARLHPGWVVEYAGQLWYDPGNPAVRQLAVDVIADVARGYDVDGVHLDDYFYPYPVAGYQFADDATFHRYGRGFGSRAGWRRHNATQLVAAVRDAVRGTRPRAAFGVSPFGIWRNASTDPAGSRTAGLQAYDDLYADARAWIRAGLLDYVAPQLYWQMDDPAAPYGELARWWSATVAGTGTELYVGQAAFQAAVWADPGEIVRHLAFDRTLGDVTGEVFFHARSLAAAGLGSQLARGEFAAAARPPVPRRLGRWLSARTPAAAPRPPARPGPRRPGYAGRQ